MYDNRGVFHLKILVETSARHVHISKEHLAILFGADAELTVKKELSQPGQFACNERVTIVGPKGEMANVSILGPTRPKPKWNYHVQMQEKLVLTHQFVNPANWKVLPDVN